MSSSPLDAAPAGAALRPIAATIAVVIRDGEVLLVRRANRPDAGHWGFPGGKIDPGETLKAAAVRELFEETQVRGEARRILTALDAFDHDEDGSLRQHFILIAVLCRWIAGEPVAGDDALEARWFSVAGLASAGLVLSRNVVEVAQQATALAADDEA